MLELLQNVWQNRLIHINNMRPGDRLKTGFPELVRRVVLLAKMTEGYDGKL